MFGDRLGKIETLNIKSGIAKGLWHFLPSLHVTCFLYNSYFFKKICRLILLKCHFCIFISCLKICSDSPLVLKTSAEELNEADLCPPTAWPIPTSLLFFPSGTFQIWPNWFVLGPWGVYFPPSMSFSEFPSNSF